MPNLKASPLLLFRILPSNRFSKRVFLIKCWTSLPLLSAMDMVNVAIGKYKDRHKSLKSAPFSGATLSFIQPPDSFIGLKASIQVVCPRCPQQQCTLYVHTSTDYTWGCNCTMSWIIVPINFLPPPYFAVQLIVQTHKQEEHQCIDEKGFLLFNNCKNQE